VDLVTVAAATATALRQPNARSNEPMSSTTKSLPKTQNFNLPKHENFFFSGEPTSHKSILSQNPWGRAQKLLMPLTESEILQPWLMTPKIQFTHLNQHTHTHAHTDFHKSLQPWWSSKISLLILINTKGFQKFLQPMMKLKNQVAHINQQSSHILLQTLWSSKISVRSSAESTQNCFCKAGNRIIDTKEEEEEQQQQHRVIISNPHDHVDNTRPPPWVVVVLPFFALDGGSDERRDERRNGRMKKLDHPGLSLGGRAFPSIHPVVHPSLHPLSPSIRLNLSIPTR